MPTERYDEWLTQSADVPKLRRLHPSAGNLVPLVGSVIESRRPEIAALTRKHQDRG
jgi:hypothetical protein